MKTPLFFCLLIALVVSSCRQEVDQQDQLTAVQAELMLAKAELAKATTPTAITHLVYLDLKEDIDLKQLRQELERLGRIEGVKDYQIGSFLDLDDPRAMAQYELVLSMGFASEESYRVYQEHPSHQEVKAKLGPYLAGPPLTYDFE